MLSVAESWEPPYYVDLYYPHASNGERPLPDEPSGFRALFTEVDHPATAVPPAPAEMLEHSAAPAPAAIPDGTLAEYLNYLLYGPRR